MKPILLVVMDGIGCSSTRHRRRRLRGAYPRRLTNCLQNCPTERLKAHGTAVGLPTDDDMGNSEVGHNALGCGQIYSQGAKLVNESIESGKIFESGCLEATLIANCVQARLTPCTSSACCPTATSTPTSATCSPCSEAAKKDGVKHARVHILLDGRDVPATSALDVCRCSWKRSWQS